MSPPENCSELQLSEFMLLAKFVNNRDDWEVAYKKCFEATLQKEFKSFFNNRIRINSESKIFADLHKKLENLQGLSKLYERELVTSEYKILKKILEDYKTKDDFLSSLLRLSVYTLVKNYGAATNVIKQVINTDFRLYSIAPSWWNKLTVDDRQNVLDLMYESLKFIADAELPSGPKNMFFQYINALDPGDRIKSIINSKSIDVSLADLRKLSTSNFWGRENAMAWFVIFSQRTFEAEAVSYILESSSFFVEEKELNEMWAYSLFLPADEAFRKNLVDILKSTSNAKTPEQQFLASMFLEHEALRFDVNEKLPPFQLRRNLYYKMYEEDIAIDLAVYNLYLLSDKDSNLWIKLYHDKI
jgi:hypothetical protein